MTSSQASDAEPPGLDSATLRQMAAQAGTALSDRMLETFRAQGLIPRPRRAGYRGRTPQWRYPPGTDQQLLALLRWRQHTKNPDLLKILLWVDGFAIADAAVREPLASQLQAMIQAMEQEIRRQARTLGLNPDDDSARGQAIDALARTAAARRGKTSIPRHGRVSASDREQAIALMVRVFGLGQKIQATPAEAAAAERVLGVTPNARKHAIFDAEPWLAGPAEELFTTADIVSLPHLLEVIRDASDTELNAARQTIVALFRHMPMMVRIIGAVFDDDNYTGLTGLSQIDQQPETVTYIVPMVIAMLRAGWTENLNTITEALRQFPQISEQAQRILDMPNSTVQANLEGQPAETRQQAQRLINAAIEGKI